MTYACLICRRELLPKTISYDEERMEAVATYLCPACNHSYEVRERMTFGDHRQMPTKEEDE